MRRLLEAGATAVGGSPMLRRVGTSVTVAMPEFTAMLHSLDAPDVLFDGLEELSGHFSPILAMSARRLGPSEWLCRQRFEEGFAPFPEYCDFTLRPVEHRSPRVRLRLRRSRRGDVHS